VLGVELVVFVDVFVVLDIGLKLQLGVFISLVYLLDLSLEGLEELIELWFGDVLSFTSLRSLVVVLPLLDKVADEHLNRV
jgi:hypothetical protein